MATDSTIKKALAMLCTYYRVKDGDEHMGRFLQTLPRVLHPYPDAIIDQLAHPRAGVASECSFFPSIHELKAFCDKAWDRYDPRVTYDRAPLALPPADRADSVRRVLAMAAAFRADATGQIEARHKDPAEERAKAERELARLKAELAQIKLGLSDEARSKLATSPWAP